jgi:hypothetical protein
MQFRYIFSQKDEKREFDNLSSKCASAEETKLEKNERLVRLCSSLRAIKGQSYRSKKEGSPFVTFFIAHISHEPITLTADISFAHWAVSAVLLQVVGETLMVKKVAA